MTQVAPAGTATWPPRTGSEEQQSVRDRRPARMLVLVLGLLVLAAAASVLVGSRGVSPAVVLQPDHPLHPILQARGVRTLVGLAVGGALGLAGALLQGLTRNPLADPGILGVNAGAGLAMVVAIAVVGLSDLSGYVWFGFAGAAGAMVLVHLVASCGRDGATPVKIAIAGAAITAAATSWTSAMLLTDRRTMEVFRTWQVGTIGGRSLDVLVTCLPFLAAGILLGLASARLLDALALGEDLARGLGRRIWRDRLVVGTAATLLAGTATALAGPVAFVGLAVPHAIRALAGPAHTHLLGLSMLGGAVLTLAADVVGRVVLPPSEVQVGIMTALVGVPVLVLLVRRGRAGGL